MAFFIPGLKGNDRNKQQLPYWTAHGTLYLASIDLCGPNGIYFIVISSCAGSSKGTLAG